MDSRGTSIVPVCLFREVCMARSFRDEDFFCTVLSPAQLSQDCPSPRPRRCSKGEKVELFRSCVGGELFGTLPQGRGKRCIKCG